MTKIEEIIGKLRDADKIATEEIDKRVGMDTSEGVLELIKAKRIICEAELEILGCTS